MELIRKIRQQRVERHLHRGAELTRLIADAEDSLAAGAARGGIGHTAESVPGSLGEASLLHPSKNLSHRHRMTLSPFQKYKLYRRFPFKFFFHAATIVTITAYFIVVRWLACATTGCLKKLA